MSLKKSNELGLFDSLSILQKSTDELAVWSPLTNQLVIIAYPMSRGKRIEPRGLLSWMQRRKVAWVCPCSLDESCGMRSCRIVCAADGNVYTFCAENPSRCNFFINITKAHANAIYESEYLAMPTTVSATIPDMEGLRKRFLDTIPPSDVLPYFEGYFGEHESMHPGLVQANGGFNPFATGPAHTTARTGVTRIPRSTSEGRFRYSPMANVQVPTARTSNDAGPSQVRNEMTRPTILSTAEYDLLATLGRGDGISSWERDDLFETCDRCQLVLMRSAFRHHIKFCRREKVKRF